jgi:hypothetical protein
LIRDLVPPPGKRGRAAAVGCGLLVVALCQTLPVSARDRGADGNFDKRTSSHFVLFQDVDIDRTSGFRGSRRFEKQVLETLEKAYDKLDEALGLRPSRKLEVVVYDPRVFDHHFGGRFGFQAAGFYSGTIHIRGDSELHTQLVRTLYHELVHAAFDAEAASLVLPAWLNEGLAEWFEARSVGKRRLSAGQRQALARLGSQGALFTLWQLGDSSFAQLDGESAALAYLQSYAFIEYLARNHGDDSLRRLCDALLRKRDLGRAFESVYRSDLDELEARFASEYGVNVGG